MLEFITKSKIRKDLLSLFFTGPSKEYYLQELHRLLGYSAGNIRRELLRFRKDNLFVTRKVANLLYYSLNVQHPLFHELKSIISKTIGVRPPEKYFSRKRTGSGLMTGILKNPRLALIENKN